MTIHDLEADTTPVHDPPSDGGEGGTWRRVDLTPVLSGQWEPPQATVGRRSDGVGLFYPGKLHTVASESEAGKTWLALATSFEELRAGNSVLYIDFEDDEGGVAGRLLALQTAADVVRDRFLYLRPTERLGFAENLSALGQLVATHKPTLAVIDGVTEAMTLHGFNPNDNADIAAFGRILPRRLASAGCATVCLDHLPKATDNRGRYAIGGVHKLNGVDGAALLLESREPFGIGLTGRSTITIAKDRPGQLRKHGHRGKDGLYTFAELELTSHDITYAEFEIRPATRHDDEFMPTVLMTKISEALTQHGPLSQRKILATVGGKRDYAIKALTLLQRDGYVSDETPHQLLKPYPGTD
ncbi:AAA family ATPase [Mycolicibacterium pulveris]|uniref:AAA family ATPase n=1 Tax=Mycolicibacterium pulveris TaxID=36813 RepID=UPI003CEC70B7